MNEAIAITDHVHWVGVNDRETDLFEGLWPLPRGVSYNAYVLTGEKTAVLDTVKRGFFEDYLAKVRSVLGEGRTVDHLVLHHLEPDHAGSVHLLREVFPDAEIVGNKKTAEFLAHLYGVTEGVRVVEDGEWLDLGGRRVQFHLVPMVHWPETMVTYEPTEQVLFSGDAFGGFGALDGGLFDDQVDVDYYDDEILRYFSNIVGKYCAAVDKAIAKLQDLPIGVLAPSHGPVWRTHPERILRDYARWSRHEAEPGVVIAYASMYGNTTRMMEAVAEGVHQAQCCTVRVHDLCRTHVSTVIRDAWRYRALVLGAPTYDAGLHPPMDALVRLLEEKRLRRRLVGCFGTYGWSGGGVKALTEFVQRAKLELVEPVVEARFSPTSEDLAQCLCLGRAVVERLQGDAS